MAKEPTSVLGWGTMPGACWRSRPRPPFDPPRWFAKGGQGDHTPITDQDDQVLLVRIAHRGARPGHSRSSDAGRRCPHRWTLNHDHITNPIEGREKL